MQLCACTRGQNKFRRKNADNTVRRTDAQKCTTMLFNLDTLDSSCSVLGSVHLTSVLLKILNKKQSHIDNGT